MRTAAVIGALTLAGCLQPNLVDCADDRVCPNGTTCVAIELGGCATPAQLAACAGAEDATACDYDGAPGACFDGVCAPIACGNARVEPGEACDDGNAEVGDGCAYACRSNETCGNGFVDPVRLEGGILQNAEQCDDGNRVAHDGCAIACRLESPTWVSIQPGSPRDRSGTAMVSDLARERLVVFGGYGAQDLSLGDTWEWDGEAWQQIPTVQSPAGRSKHAMAYDSDRHVVVLFGGVSDMTTDFDPSTWTWDGSSWTRITPPRSPVPVYGQAMAYDAARGRVVMYGGAGGGFVGGLLATTEEWDGTTWTQVCDACGPGKRVEHAMAYDPSRGVIVMFGGEVGGVPASDLWEYDGTWHPIVVTDESPTKRAGAAMAFDPALGVVLSGGYGAGGVLLTDTWAWDGVSWKLLADDAAAAEHSIAYDSHTGGLVRIGGDELNGYRQTTDHFDGTGWRSVFATIPELHNVITADDPLTRRTLVIGGRDTAGVTGGTWLLRDGFMTPHAATVPPREFGAATYDPAHDMVVLFGGSTGDITNLLGDTWLWNRSAWIASTPATSPSPRMGHAMAYDGSRVILFGGVGGGAVRNDMWEWTGTTWSPLTPPTLPPARHSHTMAFDPIRRHLVLFGGIGTAGFLDDAWIWDGVTWTSFVAPGRPSRRSGASMRWDAARRRLVLFGGYDGVENLDDTWELDGTTWSRLSLFTRPSGGSMASFALTHGIGVFANTEFGRLRWESVARDETCAGGFDLDDDGLVGCDDPDCWASCTPLCPPGASCASDAPRCGDNTCDLAETCRLCPTDCGTCTAQCGDAICANGETALQCPGDC